MLNPHGKVKEEAIYGGDIPDSSSLYHAFKPFNMLNQLKEYYFPQGIKLAILTVNKLFVNQIVLAPFMILTVAFNPYRCFEFFRLSGHTFVNYNISTNPSLAVVKEKERKKQADIIRLY
jgi:hypothetical protein